FTWVPAENQGPNFYTLTVRVTDNGSPPLSTTRSFQVTVREANIAPILGSLPTRTATEGVALSFTATATDADLPTQALTFALDPGAPAGASITAGGLFTWTPTEAQGAIVFPITIRVTDDSDPVLSDFRT